MRVRSFNRYLRTAVARSEATYEPLVEAYAAALAEVGREATRALRARSVALTAAGGPADPKFRPPDVDELLPADAMSEAVDRRTRKLREQAARTVLGGTLDRVGIAWNVGGVFSDTLTAMAGARLNDFNAAARDLVRVVIEDALTKGSTVPETAAAITEKIGEIGPGISTMLARTDLVGTQNGASVMAAREVYPDGNLQKRWLSTSDERTRPTHDDADGQTVPLDQQFTVGDATLDYPGDPSGPDEEVCNCRCTVIYEEVAAVVASAGAAIIGESIQEDSMSTTETEEQEATGTAWRSVLAVEGVETEDGRYIEPGALRWRELPLTLMGMIETTEGGHLGAQVAGRIDEISREGNSIVGLGVFDSDGEYGAEIERLVRDRTLRGVSIDPIVLESEYRLGSADGEVVEGERLMDAFMEGEKIIWVYLDAVLLGATVCPMQAIEDADIEILAGARQLPRAAALVVPFDPFGGDALTASAAGHAPVKPPAEWFEQPILEGPTAVTILDDGRVFGHLAIWGTCHTSPDYAAKGICKEPPHSATAYSHFHLGEIECDGGEHVACGQITLDTGHAALGLDPRYVISHYDDTGTAAADVRVYEDAFGIVVAGAIRPDLPDVKLRALRGAKLSGDWRKVSGSVDLLGILCVNVPGFPVPRSEVILASAAGGREEIIAMTGVGMSVEEALAIEAGDAWDAEVHRLTDDVLIEHEAAQALIHSTGLCDPAA